MSIPACKCVCMRACLCAYIFVPDTVVGRQQSRAGRVLVYGNGRRLEGLSSAHR